jgi:cytochrome c oxidase cbb3-type subunit 3
MNSQSDEKYKLHVAEDEKHLLLDHNYDDIQELNHPLPRWWNIIFYTSVVFAIGYFSYYQFLGGPSLKDEFKQEYKAVVAAQEEFKRINSQFDPKHYDAILADDGVKKGFAVYELNCMPCHMEKGQGDVGPNLTDNYWILAKGTPESIHKVVFNGSEENGMPVWGELLTKDEIYQAVAYVMTLKNTYVKGKEPQGDKVEE